MEGGVGARFEIKSIDGYNLAATRISPQRPAKAVVVIPGAMGVRQDYYSHLPNTLPSRVLPR